MMIPVSHITHTAHPSPRSRALAERLRTTIHDFQSREPKLTREEIDMALREVQGPGAGAKASRPVAIAAGVLGVVLAIGVAFATEHAKRGGSSPGAVPMVAMLVVGIGVVAAVALKMRNDK